MFVLKSMLNSNFDLLSNALFLLCIISSVFSETNVNPASSCEKLKFSPVLQVSNNKTTGQFLIFNRKIQEDGKNITSELIKETAEDLLIDSVNNDGKVNCTCKNPCRITCCASGQSLPNSSSIYDFISSEEYQNYSYSKGKKPCAKNFRSNGYFSPLSFHNSTKAFYDFHTTLYSPPINVRDEEIMIFTTSLEYFCDEKKMSLENVYDYYLINDSALLRKPKSNSSSSFELVLTKNYCTVPRSSSETFFEICGNHYSLYLEENVKTSQELPGVPRSSAGRAQVLRYDGIMRTNPFCVLISLPFLTVAILLQRYF